MMPLNNVCPENFSLEERFNKFLGQLEGAENIDTLFSEEKIQSGKRADFLLTRISHVDLNDRVFF